MPILYVANSAAEVAGQGVAMSSRTQDVGFGSTPVTNFNTLPGSVFGGFDPDYAQECIAIWYGQSSIEEPFRIQHAAPASDTYWLHFRVLAGEGLTNSAADGVLLEWRDGSGNLIADIDMADGFMIPRAIGDTTVASATSFQWTQYSTYFVDIEIVVGANITINAWMNGVQVGTATAANTGAKGKPVDTYCRFDDCSGANPGSGTFCFFSEIIITDNENPIGWRVATMKPNAAGGNTGMAGNISDLLDPMDGVGLSSANVGDRASWTLGAYPGPASPTSIRGVVTKTRTSPGSTGPQQIRHHLRISATDYDSALLTPSPAAGGEMVVWDSNPATTSAWATADLTGLEQGVEVET
jgi:hypothetical protein